MKRGLMFALLAASCGGQVEHSPERERPCHVVKGYFADQRCSQRIEFDWCDPPEFYFSNLNRKCELVRP